MKWNKNSIEWAMKAVARHNDVPDYFLDNSADKFIEAYEYFETRYSDKTKEEITLGMHLPEMSHWGMKIKVPNNEHTVIISGGSAVPYISKLTTKERQELDLRTLYPDMEALRKGLEEFGTSAERMSEAIKKLAKSQEDKRTRQKAFGKINKKDPRRNLRNYLKGKK